MPSPLKGIARKKRSIFGRQESFWWVLTILTTHLLCDSPRAQGNRRFQQPNDDRSGVLAGKSILLIVAICSPLLAFNIGRGVTVTAAGARNA